MKKLKQWESLDQRMALILTLLTALFLEIIVTKVVVLIRPEMDPWHNASAINKIYMPFLAFLVIILYLKTPLDLNWAALKIPDRKMFKREMLEAVCISVVLILVMIGVRLWKNAHDPATAAKPWFNLYLHIHGRWFYPVNTVLQEIMIKAFTQENMRCMSHTGNRHFTVILTCLFFSILHMNYKLYYMIGAGLYCLLTGYLYERDRNIWGSTLIHFTIGFLPRALGLY